MSLTKEKLLNM